MTRMQLPAGICCLFAGVVFSYFAINATGMWRFLCPMIAVVFILSAIRLFLYRKPKPPN
jgi:hypothetical protein